jgi:hypothetical protein
MAQDFQTSTPLEAPRKRSNTGLLIGILAILVLCCVCVIFPLIFYFWLGDLLIDFFRNVMSADGFALVSHLL